MWLALRLLASGAFDVAMKGLSAAFQWVTEDWRNLALAIVFPCLLWSQFITVPELRHDLTETSADLVAERSAHLGTVNAFLAASRQAQKDAEANAQRVAREQEIITDAITGPYRAKLAALRHRFELLRNADRLRAGSPRTDPGRADPAGVPGLPAAAGRADAAAGEDRLPAPGELSLPDALIASEQALQLQALIDWVAAQSAVRFTPEGSR